MPADLHCHSVRSDGTLTPKEIVMLAKTVGLTSVAVTDHDTFAGAEEAMQAGKEMGIDVIYATEVSCYDYAHGKKVHILCYLPKHPEVLEPMLQNTTESRRQALINVLPQILEEYPMPKELVFSRAEGSVGFYKQHIMHALIDAGYAGEVFGTVFKRLFGKNGTVKTHHKYPDVYEAVELIHKAEGKAVLAHPAVYGNYDIIPSLIQKGLDGIEVSYPRAAAVDLEELSGICSRYGLIKTGGTDFHGRNSNIPLALGTCTTEDGEVEKLKLILKK